MKDSDSMSYYSSENEVEFVEFKAEVQPKKEIVIFDFDGVFKKDPLHTHNLLYQKKVVPYTSKVGLILNGSAYTKGMKVCKKYNEEVIHKHGKEMFDANGLREPTVLAETIKLLMEKGIHIVIASHNQFPAIIDFALEYMGFNQEEQNKIDVICGFPITPQNKKNEHIKLAMQLKNIKDYTKVLFVDDDSNCSTASNNNLDYIWVSKTQPYCSRIKTFFLESEIVSSSTEILGDSTDSYSTDSL